MRVMISLAFLTIVVASTSALLSHPAPLGNELVKIAERRSLESSFNVAVGWSFDDASYYTTVEIGSPPIAFKLLISTTLSGILLAGKGTNSTEESMIYDPSLSSSSILSNLTTSYPLFNDKSIGGRAYSDIVTLGNVSLRQNITVSPDDVLYNALFFGEVSGVIGLAGIGYDYGQPGNSLIKNLFINDPNNAQFSIAFKPGSSGAYTSSDTNVGVLTIGQKPDSLASVQSIKYNTPCFINGTQADWTINLEGVRVNNLDLKLDLVDISTCASFGLDSSIITLPNALTRAIYASIPGAQIDELYSGMPSTYSYWTVPCDSNVTLSFTFGGFRYSVDPVLQDADSRPSRNDNGHSVGKCSGRITSLSQKFIFFGTDFMQSNPMTFKYSPPSIGLSYQVGSNSTIPSGTTTSIPGATFPPIRSTGYRKESELVFLGLVCFLLVWYLI